MSPDASFTHAKSQYPSVMIETSYSQRQKDLTRLADEYISGSDGNIAMVLGLDIEYCIGSKKASLSIWRPRLVPDPEKEEAVLLETFSVREADNDRGILRIGACKGGVWCVLGISFVDGTMSVQIDVRGCLGSDQINNGCNFFVPTSNIFQLRPNLPNDKLCKYIVGRCWHPDNE